MGAVAYPDYEAWVQRYKEFSAIDPATYLMYFGEATLYCRNDGGGPVINGTIQAALLGMMTAHIAALYTQAQGDAEPGQPKDANNPVGRISDASEGSASVHADWPMANDASAMERWLTQTKYGASYWAATLPYRQMRYSPGCGLGVGYFVPGGSLWRL